MFTRNFYKYYSLSHAGQTPGNTVIDLYTESDGTTGPSFYSNTTTVYRDNHPSYWANAMQQPKQVDIKTSLQNNSNSVALGYGVIFGTGDTPVTIDDYTIAGDVVTGFSYSISASGSVSEDYTGAERSVKYTITNNNDTSITIKEVAIFIERVWQSKTTTGTNPTPYHHGFVMVERTVLETPIIIEAGGVGIITYNINMDYPV